MSQSTVLQEQLTPPVNGHYTTEPAPARGNENANGLKRLQGPMYARNSAELEAIRAKAIHLITEDDEPVDSIYAALLQHLLVDALSNSWTPPPHSLRPDQPRRILALANVGIFDNVNQPGIAPDVLVSLDVETDPALMRTHHRSYFLWEFGKPPDLVVEIVSDRRGGELSDKKARYAAMEVPYYVVHDPDLLLTKRSLQVFELGKGVYHRRTDDGLPDLGLKMILSNERLENWSRVWLRAADLAGNKLPFSFERAQRLAAKLRELGIDPQSLS
jgi:Uma2 family endonuclease